MMEKEEWDLIIKPKNKWYQLDLGAIWKYRDLLLLLVRRDFVSVYKQTILGPIWFFIQPIITTITFTVVFGYLAKISTDGIPSLLFYLSGITLWTYFSDCLNKTSNTFIANASVFGKVYFPRLIVPLSVLFSNLFKFGIQFFLFVVVWIYFLITNHSVHPNWNLIWLLPLLVFVMAGLGLGFGIFISSITTKYRDFSFLVAFGVQLLMYATPIVYPMSLVSDKLRFYVLLNPLTSIVETFKYIFLGAGYFSWGSLIYSFTFMCLLLYGSILLFNKTEKNFMDTV